MARRCMARKDGPAVGQRIAKGDNMREKIRITCFICLVAVSVLFTAYCIIYKDRRLIPAIICVFGTSALLIKELIAKRSKNGKA